MPAPFSPTRATREVSDRRTFTSVRMGTAADSYLNSTFFMLITGFSRLLMPSRGPGSGKLRGFTVFIAVSASGTGAASPMDLLLALRCMLLLLSWPLPLAAAAAISSLARWMALAGDGRPATISGRSFWKCLNEPG